MQLVKQLGVRLLQLFQCPAGGNVALVLDHGRPFMVAEQAIAGLTAVNDSPTALGQPTNFSAEVIEGSNVFYTWDFGDGATSAEESPSHAYDTAGEYAVTLTVTNDFGSDSAQITIIVLAEGQLPNYPVYFPMLHNE